MNTKITDVFKFLLLTIFAVAAVPVTTAAAKDFVEPGAVYAMSNKSDGNEIVVYDRAANGRLTFSKSYLTGGLGTGGDEPFEPVDALGSQSPLILNPTNTFLFAVNAISNSITVFRINHEDNTLELTDMVDTNGDFPVSLTLHDDILYVLNSGGSASISGFEFDNDDGRLAHISGSTRSLHFVGDPDFPRFLVSPATISFDKGGERLVVTVKGSNSIHVFSISRKGQPVGPRVTTASQGRTPFGLDFDRRGHLLVAEAFGAGDLGQGGASAVTSYAIRDDNTLEVISPSVGNFQTASCWLETNSRIPFAYTTNNASDTVSGYGIEENGLISLLNSNGIAAISGHAPVDLALTKKGEYLYTLNAGDGTISMFKVNANTGHLSSLGKDVDGLPVDNGAVGIVAR